jgi:putative hydrolase of the HAD superfamily
MAVGSNSRQFSELCPIMQPVKNIIFDFGNVLFDLDLPAIERNLKLLCGENFAAAKEKLYRERIFELYEVGGLSTEEFVDALRFASEQPLEKEQVIAAWNSIFLGMPRHRFELLLRLRERYKVFLLSNINDLHASWIDDYMVREHGIGDFHARYFDGVYYSHLIRLRKPDHEVFEYVLADAELAATETIFFDDMEANVAAAKEVGIRGILHPAGREITEAIMSHVVY